MDLLGLKQKAFFGELGRRLRSATSDANSHQQLIQRISVANGGNAAWVIRVSAFCFPVGGYGRFIFCV